MEALTTMITLVPFTTQSVSFLPQVEATTKLGIQGFCHCQTARAWRSWGS